MLIDFCKHHDLVIINTEYKKRKINQLPTHSWYPGKTLAHKKSIKKKLKVEFRKIMK